MAFSESILRHYKNDIKYNRDGQIETFCGHKVKMRNTGSKFRVVGSKILSKILNKEL